MNVDKAPKGAILMLVLTMWLPPVHVTCHQVHTIKTQLCCPLPSQVCKTIGDMHVHTPPALIEFEIVACMMLKFISFQIDGDNHLCVNTSPNHTSGPDISYHHGLPQSNVEDDKGMVGVLMHIVLENPLDKSC